MPIGTSVYATLDEALEDIAQRSFYESALVTPLTQGGFEVADYYVGSDDVLPWSYEYGAELPPLVHDYTRTFEAWETWSMAEHVRYAMSDAVHALEAGIPVIFQYVIAEASCECPNTGYCTEEHTAGWLCLAFLG